jgi:membrane protein
MRRQLARFERWQRTRELAQQWINLAIAAMLDFLKHRVRQSAWTKLAGRTLMKWQQDDCLEMGAALAYYGLFSMFPMILVSLSIVGFLIGPSTVAYDAVLNFAQEALPPDAFPLVQATLTEFSTGRTSASIVGFGILLFTSGSFFGALSRSFDKIWHTKPRHHRFDGMGEVAFIFIWRRFLSFLLVMGATSLIFLSLLSNIVLNTISRLLAGVNQWVTVVGLDQVQLLSSLRLSISFVTLTLVVMVLYKTLPSTRVAWRDVFLGALFTSVLWLILQQLISNSVISLGSRFSSYGVVGGVMVLMLWIYLTSQIFFLGGELTYVYAHLFGSRKGQKKLLAKVGDR